MQEFVAVTWRHHDSETLSLLLALCEGNPLVTTGFPTQIWCFFIVGLSKLTCGDRVISVWLGQNHGCWCPGSLRRQDISSHDIDNIECVSPSLTWGRILSTCVKSIWRNDKMQIYVYVPPEKNLVSKGLIIYTQQSMPHAVNPNSFANSFTLIRSSTITDKYHNRYEMYSLIARFMGPTWGPSGADRTQVGPVLAPWTLLTGLISPPSRGWVLIKIIGWLSDDAVTYSEEIWNEMILERIIWLDHWFNVA